MSWPRILGGLLQADLKLILRDRFLVFLLVYSLILALLVRYFVPKAAEILAPRGIDLLAHAGLISSFLGLTLGSAMVGLVLGFLLLDSRETRILEALSVSPVTFGPFLAYRTALPMVLALGLNPLCAWLGGIGLPALGPLLALATLGATFGGISTLALATFADNKVQAFAVMKMISGTSMLPLGAYFLAEPWQYLCGLFPPYWLFKAWWVAVEGVEPWWPQALIGLLANLAFLYWMKTRFERRVRRG